MKLCSKCKIEKPKVEFYLNKVNSDGLDYSCKSCRKEYEYKRYKDSEIRKNKIQYEKKKYAMLTKEQKLILFKKRDFRKHNKAFYWSHRDKVLSDNKIWRDNNLEWQRNQSKRKYATIKGCLNSRMACGVNHSLRNKKNGRAWELLVGYSVDDLKSHIESLFVDGMGWDNRSEWHIDHIVPKSFFEFTSVKDVEFRMCWRLENLQRLWASDNISKGNKIKEVA